ncbi:threonine ammonia-lyase, biosynthetic [Radiomyces spectabilis]|uniref:threonine ammonia-lyase, biosynthetic n=1 Tax=Radiomyces spectabilis TaxID=64574 RepID=UPI00221EB391|nr:threonine ammonia-lyase, biosynthetic [Radiomyces spectabilis]KAI8391010.1 threonine ammonia-lyase, biosynthetic [Radiomyces spectabilis]
MSTIKYPRSEALVETDTLTPQPHLTSSLQKKDIAYKENDNDPDYLRLILTARVYDIINETPLQEAVNLNAKIGAQIFLKREDLQPVFSFKIRGAYNKMANLTEAEKKAGVIACSAGNHAQGVAYSAKKLGIKAKIVMPIPSPAIKWRNVQRLGAEVVLFGNDFDEAKKECARLMEKEGLTNIPPYDDPYVIAGQGTIGMELLRQHDLNNIATIFICIGGGGLIAGIGSYVKRIAPHIRIIGVEAEDACAMHQSLQSKERVELKEVGLFADGAAVRLVGEETFRLAKDLIDDMILVNNDEICAAIKDVFEDTRSICEPTGALALAGAKKWLKLHPEDKSKGAHITIVSGANVNFDRLRFISNRAELGENSEAFCNVTIPEKPGSFMTMIQQVQPRAVTEFSYRYADPVKAHIYISFKVKDLASEVQEVIAGWKANGMEAWDVSHNELAKTHARYMVGGNTKPPHERVFRFIFPERPGALMKFLEGLESKWNVSLFHYRNHGDDMGKVFLGVQVPPRDNEAFSQFLDRLGYHYIEETDNVAYKTFLCNES